MPRPAAPVATSTSTSRFDLELAKVQITNLTSSDRRKQLVPLREALVAELERSGATLVRTTTTSSRAPALIVRLRPEVETSRTYVLDGLSIFPFLGLLPITPNWGTATVEADVEIHLPSGRVEVHRVSAAAEYSHVFYAWYRNDRIRVALERAYARCFRRIAELVAAELNPSRDSEGPWIGPPPNWLGAETEEGFRVIARPVARAESPGLLTRYLGPLGGLEGAITGGGAYVASHARTESGEERVGEGRAVTSGFRVSFFRPPSKTGFFFPPLLGFFSQDIDITGFVDPVPLHQVPGAFTVGATVTDPETYAPVDLSQPLSYGLRLRSGYLGQGIGLNLVLGTDDVQLFGTLRFGLNLLEVRHTDVTLETARELGWSAAFASSGQLGAQAGLTFPDLHLSLRVAAELEYFRSFSFPEPLEFQASTVFNPEKQIYERARVFVEGAEVSTLNWQVSLTYLF